MGGIMKICFLTALAVLLFPLLVSAETLDGDEYESIALQKQALWGRIDEVVHPDILSRHRANLESKQNITIAKIVARVAPAVMDTDKQVALLYEAIIEMSGGHQMVEINLFDHMFFVLVMAAISDQPLSMAQQQCINDQVHTKYLYPILKVKIHDYVIGRDNYVITEELRQLIDSGFTQYKRNSTILHHKESWMGVIGEESERLSDEINTSPQMHELMAKHMATDDEDDDNVFNMLSNSQSILLQQSIFKCMPS